MSTAPSAWPSESAGAAAKDVVGVLEELISVYPAPTFIRADNGPEFIAQALQDWC